MVIVTSASTAVVATVATLVVQTLAERRLRAVASLERDLRSADLFVTLMKLAKGRGETVVFEGVADAISRTELFSKVLTAASETSGERRVNLAAAADLIISSAVVSAPVGRAAQLAAAQLAASLADQYAVLRPGAMAGLREVKSFLPEVEVDRWATRWGMAVQDGAVTP